METEAWQRPQIPAHRTQGRAGQLVGWTAGPTRQARWTAPGLAPAPRRVRRHGRVSGPHTATAPRARDPSWAWLVEGLVQRRAEVAVVAVAMVVVAVFFPMEDLETQRRAQPGTRGCQCQQLAPSVPRGPLARDASAASPSLAQLACLRASRFHLSRTLLASPTSATKRQ